MFLLSSEPLDERPLEDNEAGGFVTFIGRVRRQNEGRKVRRLEYEAYAQLAQAEGEAILSEAVRRYAVIEARCSHRIGTLELGDAAIRVDVAAAHRKEAFAACRFIVDEVKRRVPIWKKEHYEDGDSGWIGVAPPDESETYYSRQVILPEIGLAGQARLRSASVLVVGAGGLGSPALLYLAGAGVGTIGICEDGLLEASNLHRQVLYSYGQAGQAKAALAAERVRELNPAIDVRVHPERLTRETGSRLADDYDIILDGTDNFAAKFLLNDLATSTGKALVAASVYQYEGQLLVVRPGGPCLRCLWPEEPSAECVGSCAEVGVLGVVPGLFGVLQAAEAIKLVLGLPSPLQNGRMLMFGMLDYAQHLVEVPRNPECRACGTGALSDAEWRIELDRLEGLRGCAAVDLRDDRSEPLPIPSVPGPAEAAAAAEPRRPIVLVCRRGITSDAEARRLRRLGHSNVFSLEGGFEAMRARR